MTWYLATDLQDARRMALLGRLRSLTERDGKPCSCPPFCRLYASPELAARHPNAAPVEIILTAEGPEGAGEWRTRPIAWIPSPEVRVAVGLAA